MSIAYEPPRIIPLRQTQPSLPQYDQNLISSLMLQHGNVLMLAHEKRLRHNYQALKSKFNPGKIPCHIIYPYKVNHSAALIAILHEEGAWAGVCQPHEMTLAQKLGVPGEKIMLSGPVKADGLLLDAIKMNAMIHIDNLEELNRLTQIAAQCQQKTRISLQVSGLDQHSSQFGLDSRQDDFSRALRMVAQSEYVQLQGLYYHHHEQEPAKFAQVIDYLCHIGAQCQQENLFPSQLFLGGGFPGSVALKHNTSPHRAIDSFTHILQHYERKLSKQFGHTCSIHIAPGRLLVEDAVDCACKIMAIKTHHQGIDTAYLATSTHQLPHAKWYRHPIRHLSSFSFDKARSYRLCGGSNLHHDIIRQSVKLPPLQTNDTIIIERVGAYHQSHASNRADAQPAMILFSDQGHHLIQKPQTSEDLLRHDLIPSHLRHAYHHLS